MCFVHVFSFHINCFFLCALEKDLYFRTKKKEMSSQGNPSNRFILLALAQKTISNKGQKKTTRSQQKLTKNP